MIDGSALRDYYIDLWRKIPALVAAVGGDESNIRKHQGIAKIAKSLQREVLEMPEGSIFVSYEGFKAGDRRNNEITKHLVSGIIRALTTDDDDSIPFGALMIDGIPDGEELPVRYLSMSVEVDPMDMPIFERVSAAQLPIDLWHLRFAVAETAG